MKDALCGGALVALGWWLMFQAASLMRLLLR